MEFKDRIKALREEKGISLTQLAVDFNLKEAGVRAWEMGRTKPGADTLIRLAEYFDCSADYLLGISNIKNQEDLKIIQSRDKAIEDTLSKLSFTDRAKAYDSMRDYLNIWESSIANSDDGGTLIADIISDLHLLRVFYDVIEQKGFNPNNEESLGLLGGAMLADKRARANYERYVNNSLGKLTKYLNLTTTSSHLLESIAQMDITESKEDTNNAET